MGRGAGARVRLLVAVVLCAAGALAGCGDDAGERTGSIVVPRPCDTRPDADDAYAGFPVDDVPVVDGEVANTWNGRDNGEWGCTVEIRRTDAARPAVDAALKTHDKAALYYETAPGFTGYSLGAMGEDAVLGFRHYFRFSRVAIVSERFAGMGLLSRHRAVYAALGDLMTTDIHALSIDARTPDPAATS